MTDLRPRCHDQGPGHGDLCILRPGHQGDHVHQPKGLDKTAARTWPQKPTLATGVKKPGLPGQRDQRADPKKDEGDQRTTRDE